MDDGWKEVYFCCNFIVLDCLPLNALSKDKREIEITSIGMKFVYIPPFEESIVFGFYL